MKTSIALFVAFQLSILPFGFLRSESLFENYFSNSNLVLLEISNTIKAIDTLPNKSLPYDAYHELRNGLQNSQIVFERNKIGRVAFLGGSITYNSGWRDSICNYLEHRFKSTKFEFINAGISSMGSTPAAFRLESDVLSFGKIDLLFEEAAVNDATNGRTREEQIRAMEGIIRHLRIANPLIDIVMMHFVDPEKMEDYNIGIEPDVIKNHNKVGEHYGIPTINLAKEVTDRINNYEFTWENDFINLHPSPFGQGIYSKSIIHFLDSTYLKLLSSKDSLNTFPLPNKLDLDSYDKGKLIDITDAKLDNGWTIDPNWEPKDKTGTRSGFTQVPMLIGQWPSNKLILKFKGNAVGIVVAAGLDAGIIEYRIDKNEWKSLNLFTRWSPQLHLPWYYTLGIGLSKKDHILEIRMSESKDLKSLGNVCRIKSFYVNKH